MTAREEIRAALADGATLNRMELVAQCDATPANVDTTLNAIVGRGEITKAGERGAYTYTLNTGAGAGTSRAVRTTSTQRPGKPPATKRVVTESPERDFIFALDADKRFLALMPDGNYILFSPEQTLKIADLMLSNFTAD